MKGGYPFLSNHEFDQSAPWGGQTDTAYLDEHFHTHANKCTLKYRK